MSRLVAASVLLLTAGCATLSKERGHDQVASLVEERSGRKTRWEQGTPEDAQVAAHVRQLLEGGLTRDKAVEIALVNSRRLQETYEDLGVSQADMVQAGLLQNPRISGELGFSTSGASVNEIQFSIVQEFLSLFMLPLRNSMAADQFSADVSRVAHEALAVVAEVSKAFAELQAAMKLVELRRMALETSKATAEVTQRQRDVGNISALDLAIDQTAYQQARLELSRAEVEALEHRENLNKLLGLWKNQTEWTVKDPLPEMPTSDPELEQIEAFALKNRLDIEAARKRAALMARAVGLARSSRFFGTVEVGLDYHQDPDGPRVLGPSLSLELPIFDRRGPMIARLEAEQRQSEQRLEAASIEARSDARLGQAKLRVARQTAEHYRLVLLPLRDKVVAQSQLHYNGMFFGPARLFAAKREQVEAYAEYIEALRDYWISRVELERVAGGRLPGGTQSQTKKEEAHEKHPH